MCLQVIYRGKRKKEELANLRNTIRVWKVLEPCHGRFRTDSRCVRIVAGENKFTQNIISTCGSCEGYRGGGHFFIHKKDAKKWNVFMTDRRCVQCTIQKADINNIGTQEGMNFRSALVVVVKKATFPKYIGSK